MTTPPINSRPSGVRRIRINSDRVEAKVLTPEEVRKMWVHPGLTSAVIPFFKIHFFITFLKKLRKSSLS